MPASDGSPFRTVAVEHYVQTNTADARLTALSSRRIVWLWLLEAVCVCAGSAVLLMLVRLVAS
jgi:uncharacterized membrane protein YgcG